MSTFAILILTLIGLVLFGMGGIALLPALLLVAVVVGAVWLLFSILGLVFQIVGAVLAGTLGLVAWLVFGVVAVMGMVLLPLVLPVVLVVGLVMMVTRSGRTPQPAGNSG